MVATTPAYLQQVPAGYQQQSYALFVCLFFFVAFFCPSMQIPGQYRKLNQDRFLSEPFPITAYARI